MPLPKNSGRVVVATFDAKGSPFPGVLVGVQDALGHSIAQSRRTDAKGKADFVVPAGAGYVVAAYLAGYNSIGTAGLKVDPGKTKAVLYTMQEQLAERVVVQGGQVVDLDTSMGTTTFNDTFTEDLPVLGRSYQLALTAAPGVNDANGDGNPNAHGGRARDFHMTVDGVANVDPLTGTFASNINADVIEEIEVVPNGAAAEYGRGKRFAEVAKRARAIQVVAGGVIGGVLGPGVGGSLAEAPAPGEEPWSVESYDVLRESDFLGAAENPLSTFSIDVDTASYSNVRRFLDQGRLPPKDAVRIEELINYFPYDDPRPSGSDPFSVNVEIAECPWAPTHRLARIGLKAQEVSRASRGGSNLVFLIDVSGSMSEPNKLPLVKSALGLLTEQLEASDRIAIVVYAGASGLVLPTTSGSDKARIHESLERLQAYGGTNGAEGLQLAYATAKQGFITGGVNRVILATDGDFNLGVTDRSELLEMVKKDADEGIFLTALGFGMGNFKDAMLETLADKGNGNYAYIDSPAEARKVLVDQIGGTLVTVAKDVKIQVEFNPARVASYRLVGYENRVMPKEHFNDDTKDAGEIGSGHSVTALYEIVPSGMEARATEPSVDPLKYQTTTALSEAAGSGELLTVKLRYKTPEGKDSSLISQGASDPGTGLSAASSDFKFASAVAMFGMILRNSPHRGEASIDLVSKLAGDGMRRDDGGYRAEFQALVAKAAKLLDERAASSGPVPVTP